MIEQKIFEICRVLSGEVPCSKIACPYGGQEHSVSEYECAMCSKQAILALIASEQQKHNTIRWYTAKKHYDEGTETQEDRDILSGAIDTLECKECMKQARESIKEELASEQQPMVEALKMARGFVQQYKEDCGDCDHSVNICVCDLKEALAKIDAALKGEGK